MSSSRNTRDWTQCSLPEVKSCLAKRVPLELAKLLTSLKSILDSVLIDFGFGFEQQPI